MWDLIVSVPDHCLSFYFVAEYSAIKSLSKDIYSANLKSIQAIVFMLE